MPPPMIVRHAPTLGKVDGLRQAIWVFLAGGTGACARVLLGQAMDQAFAERLPHVGVMTANLVGCLLIGFFAVALPVGTVRVAVLGGLLGGFTTYSTFALVSVELIGASRPGVLVLQLTAHLVGGILCVVAGAWFARTTGLGVP